MRLWSLHPKYLDAKGLTALWREALLAQHVLTGETKGYRHHPQLLRFSAHPETRLALACYLTEVWREAARRMYRFDKTKIPNFADIELDRVASITVNRGQIAFEQSWLCEKLRQRDPVRHEAVCTIERLECHPLFEIVEGPIEAWEKSPRKAIP